MNAPRVVLQILLVLVLDSLQFAIRCTVSEQRCDEELGEPGSRMQIRQMVQRFKDGPAPVKRLHQMSSSDIEMIVRVLGARVP